MSSSSVITADFYGNNRSDGSESHDLERLRRLLMGKDYQELLILKGQLEDSEKYSEHVANVISEALTIRSGRDDSLSAALAPTVENAIHHSIEKNANHFADLLYPIMGPAIRKSIQETFNQMLDNVNQLLEQSLSPKSLGWRIQAWKTGKSYAEIVLLKSLVFRVEQIFLIHRNTGLLLKHVSQDESETKDPEMVSGMLTAIQDFVSDSFNTDQDSALDRLQFGNLTVFIEHGPSAILAAAVSGSPPIELKDMLSMQLEMLHQNYAPELKNYVGDNSAFEEVEGQLKNCLISQQQPTEKKPKWLTYLLLASFTGAGAYWFYLQHQKEQHWQQLLETIKAQPGIVLTETQKTAHGYLLRGLQDPLAKPATAFIPAELTEALNVGFDFRPYFSIEPEILNTRIQQSLQPPEGVELELNNGTLWARGKAEQAWFELFQQHALLIPGVDQIDTSYLKVLIPEKPKPPEDIVGKQIHKLENLSYLFESNDASVDTKRRDFQQIVSTIDTLYTQTLKNKQRLKITLQGHTDEKGTEERNQQLRKARAKNIRQTLIAQHIPAFILITNDNNKRPLMQKRTISFDVTVE
jgi:OOP family OmpA-OmpF porin